MVGPPDVWRAVVKTVDGGCHVLAFATLEELDRWRRTATLEDPSIHPDLVAALIEAGCPLGDLPRRLRSVLESLGREINIPPLRRLEGEWPSRRSFYRTWHTHLEIAPAAFLRRVRALQRPHEKRGRAASWLSLGRSDATEHSTARSLIAPAVFLARFAVFWHVSACDSPANRM